MYTGFYEDTPGNADNFDVLLDEPTTCKCNRCLCIHYKISDNSDAGITTIAELNAQTAQTAVQIKKQVDRRNKFNKGKKSMC